ncbi:MAG: hypothetical protein AB8F65_01545 [Woeseiaceae bacterium]
MKQASMSMRAFGAKFGDQLFSTAVILLVGFVAILVTMGIGLMRTPWFRVPAGIFLLFATSAFLKYATVAARAIALGREPPAADSAVFHYFSELWAFAPWIALVLFNAVWLAVWQSLGQTPALVLAALMLPLLPAGIAVVCVSRQPLQVFHVPGLIRIIRIVGLDYLKIIGVWLLLGVFAALLRSMPGLGFSFLAIWLGCTQVMAVFVATGVVVFHHHAALGVPIQRLSLDDRQAKETMKRVLAERRTALDQSYPMFSRGNPAGGMQRLKHYLDSFEEEDPTAWQWFIDEMLIWESPEPGLQLARNYFSRLAADDDRQAAKTLLTACRQVSSDFDVHPKDRSYADAL